MNDLKKVIAPTLLIVGGKDEVVQQLNQEAFQKLSSEKAMRIVSGASHLFQEPGKLEEVSKLAANWFLKWLK
jgi:alpha-beta hydrolase superfamily lysophospholipase